MKKRTVKILVSIMIIMLTGIVNVNGAMVCGDGLTWDFEESVIEIDGAGEMEDFSYTEESPWNKYGLDIKEAVLNDGVTTVGSYAFYNLKSLTEIVIPRSVYEIKYFSFAGCDNLKDIYYAGTEDEWNDIIKETGNKVLETATVHFNLQYIADGSKICYDGKKADVSVKLSDEYSGSMVFLAMYKNGEFVTVRMKKYTGEELNFNPECDFDEVRIMNWNSLKKLGPLKKTKKVNLKEQFGMLYAVYKDSSGIDDESKALIYTDKGKFINFSFARNVTVNGEKMKDYEVGTLSSSEIGLVFYGLNERRQIVSLYTGSYIDLYTEFSFEASGNAVYSKKVNKLGDNKFTYDSSVICCTKKDYIREKDSYFISSSDKLVDGYEYACEAITDKNGRIMAATVFDQQYEETEEAEKITDCFGIFKNIYIDNNGWEQTAKAVICSDKSKFISYDFARNVRINGVRYFEDEIKPNILTGIVPVYYTVNSEFKITSLCTGDYINSNTKYNFISSETASYSNENHTLGEYKITSESKLTGIFDNTFVTETDAYFKLSEASLCDESEYNYILVTDMNGNIIYGVIFGVRYEESEDVEVIECYGMLYEAYADEIGIDSVTKAKIYTADERALYLTFAERVKVDDRWYRNYELTEILPERQNVMYQIDYRGYIKAINIIQ